MKLELIRLYLGIRACNPNRKAASAIRQARIWIAAGLSEQIRFYMD